VSAVSWGAEFPADWPRTRIKHVCRFAGGGTPDKATSEYWNGDIPWVSPKDMKSWTIDDTEDHITVRGLESSATKLVAPGAVLLVMRSGILRHSIPVAINRVPVALNQDMRALTPVPEIEARYLARLLEGHQQQLLNVWSKVGSTVESLESDLVGDTEIAVPPLSKQRAIAEYLDRETARLDALVAAKERVLGLLAEKRRALITRAVTRGLDPRAPLRDSGIPWLGEIPAHWGIKKLAFLASLRSGDSITADDIRDDGPYAVYGGNGLRGYTDRFTHDGEYVLIGRQGALCGNINYSQGQFWPSEHAVVVTPREQVAVRWLGELLRVMDLNQHSASAAQPGLAVDTIAALRVPIPPFEEQRAIVDIIVRESGRLDKMHDAIDLTISLLKERRAALIAAAVTGAVNEADSVAVVSGAQHGAR